MTMLRLTILCIALMCGWSTFLRGAPQALPSQLSLSWQTATTIPVIASPDAKAGGRIRTFITSFPLTLRQVGPDSNQTFRSLLDENDMSLVIRHPNTGLWMPELATHWAFDPKDPKVVYYRLDPSAQWSDGKPVKGSDFVYMLNFMRSPHIKAPWYNTYYKETIDSVTVYEEKPGVEVIAVRLHEASPDPLFNTNLQPIPEHFYGELDTSFVSTFNWKIAPNTGPYQLAEIHKGKDLIFQKKKNWWAKDRPYFQNRFNIDEVQVKIVRDIQTAFEYLKNGEIDVMTLTNPELWHASADTDAFQKGYVHRLQSYNDNPRNDYVLILNQGFPLFKSRDVRQAFHYAMNVERVMRELMKNDFQRLQGMSQGYGPYTDRSIKARTFDLNEANRLLDGAGWTRRNSEGIRINKEGQVLRAAIS